MIIGNTSFSNFIIRIQILLIEIQNKNTYFILKYINFIINYKYYNRIYKLHDKLYKFHNKIYKFYE